MGPEFGQAIGDALQATYGGWMHDRQQQLEKQKLAQAGDIARMRAEVQQMLGELNAGSRENVARTNATSREHVADVTGQYGIKRQGLANQGGVDRAGVTGEYGLAREGMANEGRANVANITGDFGMKRQGLSNSGAMARTNASNTSRLSAAEIAAKARRDAARLSGTGANTRALTSLYGTMFKPRAADPLADPNAAAAAPPSLKDWLAQNKDLLGGGADDGQDDDTDTTDDAAMDDGQDDEDPDDTGDEIPPPAAPVAARAPAARTAKPSLSNILPPMAPVPSHTPAAARPAAPVARTAVAPTSKPTTKTVTGGQLLAFAKSTKRTPDEARAYAQQHGWSVVGQ